MSLLRFLLWAAWAATAAALSASATFAMIRVARRLRIIDHPNSRSSHDTPTPRGGGLAIFAVGVFAIAVLRLAGITPPPGGVPVLAAAMLVAFVSGIDDVSSLSPRLRLSLHLVAASIAVLSTGPVAAIEIGPIGRISLGAAGWPLTIIWIVGMTNSFNFMDGIDGIAGLTAAVVLAVLAASLNIAGATFISLTAAALAAASVGFLVWNWQPAKVFLGDVGSAFLGFTIAVLPLLSSRQSRPWLLPLTTFLMWPFILDTAYTLVRRLLRGENIFKAHRTHVYQRLVIAGWSHKNVALLYGIASLATGVLFGLLSNNGGI